MCKSFFLPSGLKSKRCLSGFVGLLLLASVFSCASLSSPVSSASSSKPVTLETPSATQPSPPPQLPTNEQLMQQNKLLQSQVQSKDALLLEWIQRWEQLKSPLKDLLNKVTDLTTLNDEQKKASVNQHLADQAVIDAQGKVIADKDGQFQQANIERDLARAERDFSLKYTVTTAILSGVGGLVLGAFAGHALK
jgi:hypothetical protein